MPAVALWHSTPEKFGTDVSAYVGVHSWCAMVVFTAGNGPISKAARHARWRSLAALGNLQEYFQNRPNRIDVRRLRCSRAARSGYGRSDRLFLGRVMLANGFWGRSSSQDVRG